MDTPNLDKQHDQLSRRDFVKTSSAATLTALTVGVTLTAPAWAVNPGGSDKIRIGLIGCGRQGAADAINCLKAAPNVELIAMGDVFQDKIDASLKHLKEESAEHVKVSRDYCFVGFDAYKQVIDSAVDVVLLTAPPHFRPAHLKAAIEAGKHVFMEKPVAVDPVGVRSIIATSELAKEKNLNIVAGTQRRHQPHYIELMKRIHRGDIGEIVGAECYWLDDYSYYTPPERRPEWSDMEWQLRNWNYYTWLSGDHIVEQHVHNIDVMNWALQTHPERALGMGGRQQRTGPQFGHIYDHFAIEFEYPNGVRVSSYCRQMKECSGRIGERVAGTKGVASGEGIITGEKPFEYDGEDIDPYLQEQKNLINAIRSGETINEGRQIAESTLTAIMGRLSAYTGRALSWDWIMNASQLDLGPEEYKFGEMETPPVAIPGETQLV